MPEIKALSEAGKQDLALALILLNDFKSEGRFDGKLSLQIIKMAEFLGVGDQYEQLLVTLPPVKIVPR